ncbi:MAG: B12-binding domain-containing radical SAM protein [Deltaproteobacteria bacterium]|nr:B12-binding domain-containing radical SAM protein [Deltaproteobacteria bacterium]
MARVLLVDATRVPANSPFLAQPVGLLSLAAVLRRDGHQVRVHDCKLGLEPLAALLREFQPQVVGIRTMSSFVRLLPLLARMVRSLCPDARLVVGGPHASGDPADALARTGADAAVLGEGEATILELVPALVERADLSRIPGLWLPGRADEGGMQTPPRPPIEDLDSLPPPAWDLIPVETYFRRNRAGTSRTGRSLTVFTSRGCPYGCAFCHNLFGRRFRARSAESVLDEVTFRVRQFGADELELHDDAFNTDRDRMRDICEGLQRALSPANLAFPNGLRADRLPREDLVLLRDAGTHHIALSPETASPRLQRYLDKRMDLERLAEAARLCDQLHIFSVGYFMLGFPTETEEEMLATVDLACRLPLHTASFFTVIPFPGSRIWKEARESGRLPPSWTADCYHDTSVNLSKVPDDRFREIWRDAYRRFYMSPARALAVLRNVPNLRTLMLNSGFVLTRFLG